MENFNNIKTFVDNYYDEKIPKELCNLFIFTFHKKMERTIINKFHLLKEITTNGKEYFFHYNNKVYPFKVFSDEYLQKYDKKALESFKRMKIDLNRTLKLACSMDLVNPRLIIGTSTVGTFDLLIAYQEKGIDKVINYSRNLIMNKDDYYDLVNFKEINTVSKYELYEIHYILNELNAFQYIYEFLIFTKEIFKELANNEDFYFLKEKYNGIGMNHNNYLLFGSDSDHLYFTEEDVCHMKYDNLVRELDDFTENPSKKTKHISFDKKKEIYKLKERNFGFFTFDLLSDMINNEQLKEELLSKSRYGKCHQNAIFVAKSLSEEDRKTTYVVGGKFKENEIDYYNHSWVEIDKKNIVIDFNHNLIMNRDKYYKLFEVKPITKTLISDIEEIIQTIIYDAKLDMHPMDINYFGKEYYNDLKKNEKILKK